MAVTQDGMKDISSIVKKLSAVKNRTSGVVITKLGVNNFTHWDNIVRYADSHQDEFELIFDKNAAPAPEPDSDEESDFGPDGGEKMTLKWLNAQHYMTLQKKAKELGLSHEGTKKELVERIFETV